MKPGRQNVILDIISTQNIETQNQLLDALAERGINATQATLSRDIKDLRLIKETGPDGMVHYVLPGAGISASRGGRLQKIVRESVISFDTAMNIIVIKTLPGLASAVCSAFDVMEVDGLVGTIAGDDTGFLAMKSVEYAEKYVEILRSNL